MLSQYKAVEEMLKQRKLLLLLVSIMYACTGYCVHSVAMVVIRLSTPLLLTDKEFTVNMERLAGLNFHSFESFPVNIHLYNYISFVV